LATKPSPVGRVERSSSGKAASTPLNSPKLADTR
jgi:hypothetical protein